MDGRPGIDEAYARAIGSSHLEMRPESTGDLDRIIAAGFVRDGLGTQLYRLRAEWDIVRANCYQALGQHESAADAARDRRRLLRQLNVEPTPDDPKKAQALAEARLALAVKIEDDMAEADRAALTSRALIMVHLKSLRGAADALGNFALGLAVRSGFALPYRDVAPISGRALEAWLDPTCPTCHGTGRTNEPGFPMAICAACGGSGRRLVSLANNAAGHDFGRRLVAQMEIKTHHVSEAMSRFLRRDLTPNSFDTTQVVDLQTRLHGLRSTQAQED
jgi:hypothetical protein